MRLTKKDIDEIIDSDGSLIGKEGTPTSGADLESQASNTTDYNTKISRQPFRYDMLGRFGFTLLPFFEGKENQEQSEMLGELINLMYDRYVDVMKFYYKNPNKLKSDYRKIVDGHGDPQKEVNIEYANKIIKTIEKYFENAFDSSKMTDENDNIVNETTVVEDKMVDKKSDNWIDEKSKKRDIHDKKIERVAGLINKMDKKDMNKLINLLEIK